MCSHYLFEPEFCNPASGWEKGIVEKNVQDRRRQVWREAAERRWTVRHPLAHSLVLAEVSAGRPRLESLVETYMKPFHQNYRKEHASILMTTLLSKRPANPS